MTFTGLSSPDPFALYDTTFDRASWGYRNTAGLTQRFPVINPIQKTLVLLTGGQSPSANVSPTLYTPVNSARIHQLNIYDGAFYNIGGPLLGATYNLTLVPPMGPGNIVARVVDTLANATFDQIIPVTFSLGSTTAAMWGDVNGIHANRAPVAMRRLAARGIVPGMTGVTFGCLFNLGEQDLANGTSQAAMTASINGFISTLFATGFIGRVFLALESGVGQTSNAVRSAQAAIISGVAGVFSAGDFDTIGTSGRQADLVHWNDAGSASAATLVVNNMHASGLPY